jgi:hypothetical protein
MVDIVRVYPIVMKQGLFRRKKPEIEILDPIGEVELFTCTREPAGAYGIHPTNQEALTDLQSLPLAAFVVSVRLRLPSLSLSFAKAVKDESEYEWDLDMEGTASVVDCQRFLRFCALGLVSPDLPLSREILESWIVSRISNKVQDEIRQAIREHGSFEAVRRDEVLPVSWWERQLSLWLADCGIAPALAGIHWESAQLARAQAARIREERLIALTGEREATIKAERRQMELQAQYERERVSLETDTRRSQMQREQELALLERKHKKELIEAETQTENAQWAARKAAKEYEVAMATLDSDLNGVQQSREDREQADQMHAKTLETLAKATEVLEKLNALDILKLLAQEEGRHQTIERLLSPEFGFTPEEVTIVGYGSTDGTLLGHIREKARRDHGIVTIRKRDLQTRSIQSIRFTRGLTRDISTSQIQHLPINSSLQFEFATRRSGLVTLLNVGTSGAIYVHVPNAFVGARAAKTEANGTYEVPGPEFLPRDKIECYREDGPGGWEHIALIVSDDPVIEHGTVLRSTPKNPLVRLSEDEVQKLCEKLTAYEPPAWTGVVLSFWVAE